MMDCYSVLGVRQDASQEEIKEAYRERALECHPDRASDGEEAEAKEEFVRVRKAFEVLSDPAKRSEYDDGMREDGTSPETVEDLGVRRRSYKEAWRQSREKQTISVSQVILDRVGGLSADYKIIHSRTSWTVPFCSLLGSLFFLYEPGAIYATDIFLVDLFLCTALGGIYGLILGYAWGYTDLFLQRSRDRS